MDVQRRPPIGMAIFLHWLIGHPPVGRMPSEGEILVSLHSHHLEQWVVEVNLSPFVSLPENRSGRKRSTRRRKRAVEKLKEKAAKRGKARGSDGSLKPPPAGLKTPPK